MTLFVGCHVVKLDPHGDPIMNDSEVYVEYEIIELATSPGRYADDGKTAIEGPVIAVMKKVR